MVKNYFRVAFRSLNRNKLHSSINTIGLAIGMTCSILIALFVQFEFSYDRQNKNADKIYRLVVDLEANDWAISAFPLGALLQENFPEIETYTRIKPVEPYITNEFTNSTIKQKIFFADSTVFDVMDIELVKGNSTSALTKINSMVLTEERAKVFFGNEDPVGKYLVIGERQLEITGIFKPLPSNSHVHIEGMVSSLSYSPMAPDFENGWNYLTSHYTYLVMSEDLDYKAFGQKVSTFLDEYQELTPDDRRNIIKLQPLTSIHLNSNRGLEIEANGNVKTIYIFSAIGLFILIIACINFMNLSTAQSFKRAKEVGIRKVIGSTRPQLIFQFLSESVVVSVFSMTIATLLLILIIPEFNEISGKQLILNPIENILVVVVFIGITIFVGLFAGMYPAFFMSVLNPVTIIKGTSSTKLGGQSLRKGLVVLQFAIAFVIIVSTYIVYSQLDFMLTKDMGFEREQTLVLRLPNDSIGDLTIKNELLQLKDVQSVTRFNELPGKMVRTSEIWYEGVDQNQGENVYLFSGDIDLVETMGMAMATGKYFDENTLQYHREFVINEKAVEHFGWKLEDAVDKQMNFGERGDDPGIVIGVIKDFHFKHLHEAIDPLVMYLEASYEGAYLALKLNPDNLAKTVNTIKEHWNELVPEYEFEYQFLDESFDALFDQEMKLGQMFSVFSGLAIFISCMGLFGLTSFTMDQNKKSVAVRKVMGATVKDIFTMVSKDFLKLVFIGMIIAFPISYYSMKQWLEGFAYNEGFSWIVFVYAVAIGALVAFLAISYHTLNAATTNPVNSLKEH